MKPMSPAQRATVNKPTEDEIARISAAILDDKPPACHARGEYRGWTFTVFDSPFRAGLLLVGASKPGQQELSEEVADLDEARRWVGRLTA